jgi:hypothetical protein
MQIVRVSLSLFGAVAIACAVLAAGVVWLMLTNPVTVADAVNEGAVTPLVRELASVIYQAFSGLLKYL